MFSMWLANNSMREPTMNDSPKSLKDYRENRRQSERQSPSKAVIVPPWPIHAPPAHYPQPTQEVWESAVRRHAKNKRLSNRIHPAIRGRPKKFWYPDLCGIVPGYAKTYETFVARQEQCREQVKRLAAEGRKGTTRGLPNGWAFRREDADDARYYAAKRAEEILKEMVDKQIVDASNPDEIMGNAAVRAALEVIEAHDLDNPDNFLYSVKDRLAAMRLVADFCKAKPVQRTALAVNPAEDFLSALAVRAGL